MSGFQMFPGVRFLITLPDFRPYYAEERGFFVLAGEIADVPAQDLYFCKCKNNTVTITITDKYQKHPKTGLYGVVSIGHFPTFYVVFVPLEYVPTIPPHSTCVIVSCFVLYLYL